MTNEIKVALAILLSAVAIFFGVRFLSGQSLFGGGYEVVAIFDDAQGLTPGALVRLNGVRVGDVRAVDLGPGARQVFVTMAIDGGVEIPRGSTIQTAGLSALGEVNVEGVGDVGYEGDSAEATLGERLDDGAGAQCDGQEGDRLDPGAGDGVPADQLEGQHQLDGGRAHAAVLLGHQQRVHALLGQAAPQCQRGGVVALGPGAGGADAVGAGQQPAQGRREVLLLGGGDEPHRPAPFGSRGRPRMRSAPMLRWISLVPA